ncbi:hypothetical protein MCEMIEM12_01661 [Burkholderiaceae bacterium]|jgi:hypothetical protein
MSGHGVCCVIGAGDATGSAVARRFAREGYTVCVARRTEAGPEGILNPGHIAEAYWWLHSQPRDAWTFELDLRPSIERW